MLSKLVWHKVMRRFLRVFLLRKLLHILFFLFFEIIYVDGIKLYNSQVCKAISIIKIPKPIYHHFPDIPINFPADDAIVPSAVNVTDDHIANVMDSLKAYFVLLPPLEKHLHSIKSISNYNYSNTYYCNK